MSGTTCNTPPLRRSEGNSGKVLGMVFRSSGMVASLFTDYTTLPAGCTCTCADFIAPTWPQTSELHMIFVTQLSKYPGLQVYTPMPDTCII